jgi:hypothetical protein
MSISYIHFADGQYDDELPVHSAREQQLVSAPTTPAPGCGPATSFHDDAIGGYQPNFRRRIFRQRQSDADGSSARHVSSPSQPLCIHSIHVRMVLIRLVTLPSTFLLMIQIYSLDIYFE